IDGLAIDSAPLGEIEARSLASLRIAAVSFPLPRDDLERLGFGVAPGHEDALLNIQVAAVAAARAILRGRISRGMNQLDGVTARLGIGRRCSRQEQECHRSAAAEDA